METHNKRVLNALKALLKNEKLFNTGLCRLLAYIEYLGIITEYEFYSVSNYLSQNFPKNGYMIGLIESNYKWMPGKWEPREKWLLEQIEKLEKEMQK